MPAVARRPPAARQPTETGLTTVEVLVAAALLAVVLAVTFTSTAATTKDTAREVGQGTATDVATTVAGDLQTVLAGAVNPADLPSGDTDDCSGSASGAGFPPGQGPFVSATSTSVALCSLAPGASTAYTEQVQFADACNGSSVCTVTVTRWPAPGSGGKASTVFEQRAVSDGTSPQSPLAYDEESGSTWSTVAAPSAATLSEVEAVQLSVTVPGSAGGSGTTIERVVLLPNTLPMTQGADS